MGSTTEALGALGMFEAARRASARIEELTWLLEEGRPPSGDGPVGGCGPGDPTAREAEWRMTVLADAEAEVAECEDRIAEALAVIEGVRRCIETPWWRVLELYYVDCLSWPEVAEAMGVSRATCTRWRDAACEWVDGMGVALAKLGRGRAEES